MSIALTIAGSDPSGGAGIQGDLKTFHQFGVYGTSVLTLLSVQNTCRAGSVQYLTPEFVLDQLDVLLDDLAPQAAKTGALGTPEVIEAIASRAAAFRFPLVVDPVMISKHGAAMMQGSARDVLTRNLMPHTFLVTPNLDEAMALAGIEYRGSTSVEDAARIIVDFGVPNVLIKGGHADETLSAHSTDILYTEGRFHSFCAPRIQTPHTHGTGCTYSAAITAELAKGKALMDAVARAKQYITRAIQTNPGLGHGAGPVNHWASIESST